MKDTIYREDAIEAIKGNSYDNDDYIEINGYGAINDISALPSADRPQGKWINHFDDLFPADSTIECSICHEYQPMGIDENFCPNCGARMKGADNEDN